MKIDKKSIARLTVLAVVASTLPVLLVRSALASAPPWEPDPNTAAPYGNVVFYDADGNVIIGGSNLAHIADYAAATTGPDAGATLATLYFAAPDHTKATSLWTAGQASASTPFPNSSAPEPIKGPGFTKPLVTLGATDGDLESFLGGITPDTTAGYANIYQVRIKDSGPGGAGSGSHYWATDIQVDPEAGTWTQVYPVVGPTTTTTVLQASPGGSQYSGSSVTLSATVTPAIAGAVQFKDGENDLGAPVAVDESGDASMSTIALSVGTHSLRAAFTPTDTANFAGSTSSPVSYLIRGIPSWRPVLYGSHRVGMADKCLASFDDPAATIAYAWYHDGVAISGATSSSYTVSEAYYGQKLSCRMTATNPVGSTSAVSLSYTIGIGPPLVPIAKPYLYQGTNRTTARYGTYEYVNRGTWSPAATSYLYQWYVGTSKISGATSYRYLVPKAYVGKVLTCVVTARRLRWTNGVYKTAGVKVV